MKTIKILLTAALAAACVRGQTVTPVIPSTDSMYGLHRVPPGGGWYGRVGIPGGPPTNYTVWCDPTVSIPGTNIVVPTDGVSDCNPALQAAVTLCPSNGVVALPSGVFYLKKGVSFGSYKILRGAGSIGPNATELRYMSQSTGQPNPTVISITLNGYGYGSCQTTNDLDFGSNTIYLNWNTWTNLKYSYQLVLRPGYFGIISQTNDPNIVNVYNRYGGAANWAGLNNGSNAMTQVVLITNITVNTAAQSVAVQTDHPFYWTYSRTNFPFLMAIAHEVCYSGVEHLRIVTLNTNRAGAGGCVSMSDALRCWANDVEVDQFPRDGFFINNGYECEVDHCFVNVAQYNDSGDGYGYHIFGPNSDDIVQDNIALGCRHSIIFEAGGSGCVYAYNYCVGDNNDQESGGWVTDDCVMHASHPYMNLIEGNTFHKIDWDHQHGSSSHNTAYRNFITMGLNDTNLPVQNGVPLPYSTGVSDWTISWETWNYYENAVDNVLALPGVRKMPGYAYYDPSPNTGDGFILRLGFDDEGGQVCEDTNVAQTCYVNGNFDYISGGIVLSNAMATNFPPSLFLTTRPSWWSNNIPWPVYGGDLDPMVGLLPAQLRYYSLRNTPYVALAPPYNLKASSSSP